MPTVTRRKVLEGLGLSAASLSLSRLAFGTTPVSPNGKLTVACIGVGSQGLRVTLDLLRLQEVQVVAVCDVNRGSDDYLDWGPDELRKKVRTVLRDPQWGEKYKGPAAGREVAQQIVNAFYAKERGTSSYDGCSAYEDFRDLLAKHKDLDAVVVSTPDHWHAIIAIAAMKAGKHVYSQKPMAHTVQETAQMAKVAKETGRATQVSIFNSDSVASKQVHDLIHSGAIGQVSTVDIWTKRPSAFWKQGIPTPTTADPVPPYLNWDMWLGPAAARPFSHKYLPFIWRAWYDFGCGAIGDMGEYGLDTITRALNLGPADQVSASSTDLFPACYPIASTLHYRFPAKQGQAPIRLNWFDGGIEPSRPLELPDDVDLSTGGEGALYTGSSGKLITAFMGQGPRLLSPNGKVSMPFPAGAKEESPFDSSRPELGQSASGADAPHYQEWIKACHGGPPARANYAFEAPIVESLMLGNIAIRTQELLEWNSADRRLTRGSAKAESLLTSTYREPWSL